MKKVLLGRTNIEATYQSFGALPIQRTDEEESIKILRRAYEGGINFYDTARNYSNSEGKIGKAFSPEMRKNIYIATKSGGKTKDAILTDIQTSLKLLNTDCVDLFQAHNIKDVPDVDDENGIHAGLIEAQKRGYCRFIGVTSHRLDVAEKCVDTGLYDTLQYPLSYLSNQKDLDLVERVKTQNMGIIAMKGLAGGAITSGKAAAAFMATIPTLLPIWGIQHMHELEEFLSFADKAPEMTAEVAEIIRKDREDLAGNFCRACGYCKPCTAVPDLEMNVVMRMPFNLQRLPFERFTTKHYQEQMKSIEKCIDCGACKSRCPYEIDCPTVLRENYEFFKKFCKEHGIEL